MAGHLRSSKFDGTDGIKGNRHYGLNRSPQGKTFAAKGLNDGVFIMIFENLLIGNQDALENLEQCIFTIFITEKRIGGCNSNWAFNLKLLSQLARWLKTFERSLCEFFWK